MATKSTKNESTEKQSLNKTQNPTADRMTGIGTNNKERETGRGESSPDQSQAIGNPSRTPVEGP